MITVDITATNVRGKAITATISGAVEDVWALINELSLHGWVVLHNVVEG